MIYNSKEEALGTRDKKTSIKKVDRHEGSDYYRHFKKWNFFDVKLVPVKMGQFFLYEIDLDNRYGNLASREYDCLITYPKLGIYLNSMPCDQTMILEWVDYKRTWEWNTKFKQVHTGQDGVEREFTEYIGSLPIEIKNLPLWNDCMLVYDVWNGMPNWSQLRQAYERTWWFNRTVDEIRDLQINRIFK